MQSIDDIIQGESRDLVREKRQDIDQALAKLSVPFFRVAGNHDFNNDVSAQIWKDLYGPVYYSFEHKTVR